MSLLELSMQLYDLQGRREEGEGNREDDCGISNGTNFSLCRIETRLEQFLTK
jgi:hypothetical protein